MIFGFLFIIGMSTPVLAKSTANASDNSIENLILSAIISVLGGGVAAFFATSLRLEEFRRKSKFQQELEEEKKRIQYLNPLYIISKDLKSRIEKIVEKMHDNTKKKTLTNNFNYINENNIANRQEFEKWCNIDGHFCMATLYITATYFSRANILRSEFPFARLTPNEEEELLNYLSEVRKAFGGRYGIWETIQDSIGTYVRKSDDSLMNYREFCGEIADGNKHVWFRSLIDFYVEFHKKLNYEVKEILKALDNLIRFLENTRNRKTD